MLFSRILRAAAAHGHHAPKPFVYQSVGARGCGWGRARAPLSCRGRSDAAPAPLAALGAAVQQGRCQGPLAPGFQRVPTWPPLAPVARGVMGRGAHVRPLPRRRPHAPPPPVPPQGPQDGIFSSTVPTVLATCGAGCVAYSIYNLMFCESGN